MKEHVNFWSYAEQQRPIQSALRDWAVSHNPNLFVTLTFRERFLQDGAHIGTYRSSKQDMRTGFSYSQAADIFGTFAHALKSHYFGAKSKKRFFLLPVVEGSNVEHGSSRDARQPGTHIHFIATVPENPLDAMATIRNAWIEASPFSGDPHVYCPDNNDWCQALTTPESRIAATQYILKSCAINTDTILERFLITFAT